MKRISSFFLSTLILFVSVFSMVKMDVRAVPATQNLYDVIYYNDKNTAINIEGVYQGTEGEGDDKSGATDFAKPAPLANIFIRESDIDTDEKRADAVATLLVSEAEQDDPLMKRLVAYLQINNEEGSRKNHLQFNQKKAIDDHPDEKADYRLSKNAYNHFKGDIVSYTYVDAAQLEDGTYADVVFTYSDLVMSIQTNSTDGQLDDMTYLVCCGNKIQTGGTTALDKPANHRYGISVKVRIQVLKKDGTAADGTFYFRAADIDVNRAVTSGGYDNFKNLFKAEEDGNNVYSESIDLIDGYVSTDGYSVYIPGWPNNSGNNPGDDDGNKGYRCKIEKDGNTYRFDPTIEDHAQNKKGSFYSGFMAVVDNNNPKGLQLTVRSAGAPKTANVATFLFASYTGASLTTHVQAKHSTDEGGNIQTTSTGNAGGNLSDGDVWEPRIITVPVGTTMTYTMTPKPGYVIDKVIVDQSSLDYQSANGAEVTPDSVTDSEGNVLYYTYTFDNIAANKAIHVTWKRVSFTEYYEYDETSLTLPPEVKSTIPTRQEQYADGTEVTAAMPSATEVPVDDKKYTFNGWDSEKKTINSDDVKFIGSWTVTVLQKFTEKYSYQDEESLPQEVKDTLPTRSGSYPDGSTVTAAAPSQTEVTVGDKKYVWKGWDAPSKQVNNADVKFVGTWEVIDISTPTYQDDYEYTDYDNLPDKVKDTLPPGGTHYADGDTVTPPEITSPIRVDDKEYTFDGWDAPSKKIEGADVVFTGTWTVKEPEKPATGGGETPESGETPEGGESTDDEESSGGGESTGGGESSGGGDEESSTPESGGESSTPPATPTPAPATPPVEGSSEHFVPSTETVGEETADGSSGLTVTMGEATELTIKPVLPEGVVPGLVKKVLVAGVPLGPELYTTDGDAIIIKPEYLNLLPEGSYTVRIVYENVWTEASFAVLGARRPESMTSVQGARTGDAAYGLPEFFAVLGVLSLAACAGGLYKRRELH